MERKAKPQPSAAFILALEREHNVPVTPYLPRSIAAIRKATFTPDMIARKPNRFRSRQKRK